MGYRDRTDFQMRLSGRSGYVQNSNGIGKKETLPATIDRRRRSQILRCSVIFARPFFEKVDIPLASVHELLGKRMRFFNCSLKTDKQEGQAHCPDFVERGDHDPGVSFERVRKDSASVSLNLLSADVFSGNFLQKNCFDNALSRK